MNREYKSFAVRISARASDTGMTGAEVPFHSSNIDRRCRGLSISAETNLLQLFAHPEHSDCFFIISVNILEANFVAEQKQAYW